MKFQIAPSILSFDHSQMADAVKSLADEGADWIHFDVMDGQFVPPITFGDGMVKGLREKVDTPFEAHLMTETPDRHFDAFIKAGCQRIIFHEEATAHAHRLAGSLKDQGIGAGIAINPGTSDSNIESLLDMVDLVLIMTVNPGWGGQSFISSTLEKIKRIRCLRPDIDIEVDGGIDPKTLPLVKEAGANLYVVGSYLTRAPSIAEGMRELRQCV